MHSFVSVTWLNRSIGQDIHEQEEISCHYKHKKNSPFHIVSIFSSLIYHIQSKDILGILNVKLQWCWVVWSVGTFGVPKDNYQACYSWVTLHSCFGPPSLLVEGPTQSCFYLLVEMVGKNLFYHFSNKVRIFFNNYCNFLEYDLEKILISWTTFYRGSTLKVIRHNEWMSW